MIHLIKPHTGEITPEALPLILTLGKHVVRTKDPDYLQLEGGTGTVKTTLSANEIARRILNLRSNFAAQLTDHTLNATAVSLCDKILALEL